MTINQPGSIQPVNGAGGPQREAATPEEAAKQFEAILVRQFVAVMTDGLFKEGLAGDDGPGWMEGQQDAQRDVLTDVLTEHLVESGALRISDLLVRRWKGSQAADPSTASDQKAVGFLEGKAGFDGPKDRLRIPKK